MANPTSDPAEEIKDLREKNTELVQKVQHWKMLAAQRENEKLDLMKELNEMRLKLARLRNNGNVQASKLDSALQSASEKALNHLVRASSEIARTIDLAKTYMRERKEVDAVSPRWSAIGATPKSEKIHRVPPMMIGGQSIQPVVSLSRTLLNTSIPSRPTVRSPSQNRNVSERAVPMHMLQDVYIPLTRIDAGEILAQNTRMEAEPNNSIDSAEELGLDDSGERSEVDESQRMSDDDYSSSTRRLEDVAEDMEPENEVETPPPRNSRAENPLEGPSWLLDALSNSTSKTASQSRMNLEPDSTTEVGEVTTPNVNRRNEETESAACGRLSCEFSPTVRRRKRTSSPPPVTPRRLSQYSPRPTHRRNSVSGRVLKVMVAKMRLDGGAAAPAPAKRAATPLELFDAPSPNGATVPGVIVSDSSLDELDQGASGEPHGSHHRRERSHQEETPTSRPESPHHEEARSNRQERPHVEDARAVRQERSHAEEARSRQETPRIEDARERRDRSHAEDDRSSMQERSHEEARPSHGQDDSAREVKHERSSRGNRSRRQNNSSRCDSDSDLHCEGRTRRARNKVVSYQEKPLNRKMRR